MTDAASNRPLLRVVAERVALLLGGTLVALLVLEGGLQLAAAGAGFRPDVGAGPDGRRVILTLGDSHTYGVFLPPEEAYPGQLQKLLDRRAPGDYRVVNLGLPGTNSSELVTRFSAWAERYGPVATVVCVGINNLWNERDADLEAQGSEPWWRRLRLYRLGRLLAYNLEGPVHHRRPDIERRIDDDAGTVEHHDQETGTVLIQHRRRADQLEVEDGAELLQRDLLRLAELHRRHGVTLHLLTYSAFPVPQAPGRYVVHDTMNDVMRQVASDEGIPLIDLQGAFETLLADGGPRARYFHTEIDGHPNAVGYSFVAEAVSDHLLAGAQTDRALRP